MQSLIKTIIVFVLSLEARAVLARKKPRIIAITGSVGKTTTKDLIYTALSPHLSIRKNEKSLNSDVGIPLTILGEENPWYSPLGWFLVLTRGALLPLSKKPYPDWLVLEAGIDRPGDMRTLCSWLSPDVTVLTRFPDVPVHVEFFSSPEAVISEKRNLVRALADDGVLVVNYDDEKTRVEKTRAEQKKITFGLMRGADVRATHLEPWAENGIVRGMKAAVVWQEREYTLHLDGIIGVPPIYAALAALALGAALDLPMQSLVDVLASHQFAPGRMRILPGVRDTRIIDDTYNSSPVALEEALATVKRLKGKGRKVVVLGDMLELGEYSVAAHETAGEQAAMVADVLVTVGIRARGIAKAARASGMRKNVVIECASSREAAKVMVDILQPHDLVLVKGSQGMRLEHVVKTLLADEVRAISGELLVRQDPMWLQKPIP